jgi:tRNA pseudouridine38-40 synthase
MALYQIILAYDGTHFCGFQRQARRRTIQGVVESALRQLGWQGTSVLAAGRTDSGVHAAGQVVTFELEWAHSLETLQSALNALLPPDVAVRDAALAPPGFHPRYRAQARTYCYRIYCQAVRDPLRERYAWRIWPALELASLQGAAAALLGTHDFGAFGTAPRPGGSTVRSVQQAEWQPGGDELWFHISANAFLYRMVRRLVYLQVAVAQGRLALEALCQALENSTVTLPAGLAPAQGLTLIEVVF